MSKERPLKSAVELAMERLAQRDRDQGETRAPLTEAQKEAIARLRADARAKTAELEILHRDQIAAAGGDPEKLRELEEKHEIDRRRVQSSLESKIARVRAGKD